MFELTGREIKDENVKEFFRDLIGGVSNVVTKRYIYNTILKIEEQKKILLKSEKEILDKYIQKKGNNVVTKLNDSGKIVYDFGDKTEEFRKEYFGKLDSMIAIDIEPVAFDLIKNVLSKLSGIHGDGGMIIDKYNIKSYSLLCERMGICMDYDSKIEIGLSGYSGQVGFSGEKGKCFEPEIGIE